LHSVPDYIQFERKPDRTPRDSSYIVIAHNFRGGDMREIIRFASGTSSLGDFMVADSERAS
jgi:hypothetical protein